MFDDFEKKYDKNVVKANKKLRNAWEKFYAPMQLSQVKFRIKVNMRVKKGIYPINN